ncbi:hypothetical protein F4821DRAFT_136375 [Hypoxylon rubiginosum]|uniref:Uncharacterized protein n=1 Tax=Hypoxylon rubiginosum TaxID=110542 RepID=A0ACC0DIF1_9PEZI|nr:hypothetical protein F4821DRAFT_136375 [Hypoxylon rubiginosum]
MSLNGLDDAKVVEAHEFAAAELGGWFLLKYANRDEVELYERGNGGIVDIRGAIAKYEETSPLYGFLRYRRRNVIIKYQPDDCSRLVQARAAVHFNAVCERFTPCDTTFEISAAKDLKDSKLSAACSLHAASGSASSSSSSLRRRRLNEIAEEEEEEERERKRQSTVKEEERRTSSVYSVHGNPTSSPENVAVLDRQQISSPPRTDFASTTNVPEFTGADRPTSPTKSESAPRLSSQSTRPDLYSYATYAYGKPRVKLGPRPSLDVNKRPATAGNFRPIAALPAGFKFFSKGSKKGHSHDGEHTEKTEEIEQNIPSTTLATTIPIPEIPQNAGHQLPPRPATSSGASMKSITTSLATQPTKETKITPEKARLMKAMKLREKKMMKGQTTAFEAAPISERKEGNDIEPQSSLRIQEHVNQRTVSHADSGIAIDPPTPMTAHTEDTVSDSHPNSPTAATSSEIGVSTKASSLSESTDETVQATKDEGEEAEDTLFRQQSELSELEDPRKSVMETTPVGRSGWAEASQSAMQNTNVSDLKDAGVSQEFSGIPASNQRQTTEEPSIRESIEVDDLPELTLQTRVQPTREEDSPKSPWGLPISKFSSNEPTPTSPKSTGPSLKSKFSIPDLSIPTKPIPALPTDTTPTFSIEGRELARDESPSRIGPETRLSVQKSAKRKTTVGVIRTDFSKTTPHSEASDPLLDDALMDELQSATLQEARPMLVSKSPITPVFPNTSPLKPAPHLSRTVSNPMRGPLLVPSDVSQSSARSVSAGGAAFLHTITRQSSSAGLQAKKSNLGSSISQRIKALEKLSSTPSTEDLRPKTAAPSSTFFSVRKQSIRDSSKSPSVAERADSLKRTPERSREGTPETPNRNSRERSLSVASRLTMFEGQNAPRGRPESIQVTARIIRDPSQSLPRKAEVNNSPGDYPQLDLKQSPLVVDLQRAERAQTMYEPFQAPIELPKDTIQERRDRKSISEESEKKSRRRSSLNMVKDFIKDRRASITSKSTDNLAVMSPTASGAKSPSRPPSTHTNSGGFTHRLSISSRRSSMSRERDSTTSPPVRSPTVLSDSGSDKSNKKMKRASRFIRRLSNSLGAGRKNTSPSISPTVAEEDADQLAAASITNVSVSSSQPAVVAYMGDVNVQFPDNLLWKRRSMCLDTQGYLFLSAIQGTTNGKDKMGLKRYHMSDFRMPYIPDVEIQELPNSVVLDLMEGSSLQIACEDRAGQLNVLHTLQDAHQTHNGQ